MSECPSRNPNPTSATTPFVEGTRPKVPSPDKASRRYLVFGGWEVKGMEKRLPEMASMGVIFDKCLFFYELVVEFQPIGKIWS